MSTQNERELARDRLAKELSDAMDCTRVWDVALRHYVPG